jgi:hypothetical protein
MRRRHLQLWLVVLNLLAFNAYALSAVAAFTSHADPEMAQLKAHQGMEHKGCHETLRNLVHHPHSDHCEMPCCKGMAGKLTTQADHCACKLGSGTLQLYITTANNHDIVINHQGVDAMSTAFAPQDRTQRLLRPPIG